MDEREMNKKWINMKVEEANYAKIKETLKTLEKVKEAKENELTNFDEYETFEEAVDCGQEVQGTRFVLTEKADGRMKARFVTKGFQENL